MNKSRTFHAETCNIEIQGNTEPYAKHNRRAGDLVDVRVLWGDMESRPFTWPGSREASWQHVVRNLPQCCHRHDGVPEGSWNGSEVRLVHILLGVEHNGSENNDSHGERKN